MSLSARDLFDAGRQGPGPSAEARARVRSKLVRRIGPAVAVAAVSATAAARAAGAASLTATIVKAAALCVVGGVLLGTGYTAIRRADRKDRPVVTGASLDRGSAAAPPRPPAGNRVPPPAAILPGELAAPAAPVAASPQLGQPIQPVSVGHRAPVIAAPVRATAVAPAQGETVAVEPPAIPENAAPAPPVDGLQAELALVRAAHDALRAGQPEVALARMDQHRREYPNGALAEERDALRVSAICMLGRPDARAEAQAFLANHPESPFVSRIREACPR